MHTVGFAALSPAAIVPSVLYSTLYSSSDSVVFQPFSAVTVMDSWYFSSSMRVLTHSVPFQTCSVGISFTVTDVGVSLMLLSHSFVS